MKLLVKNTFAGERLVFYNPKGETSYLPEELAGSEPKFNPESIYVFFALFTRFLEEASKNI
ncbi:MAG: hypothetical protein Q8R08_01260 [bacterium]|nr:hypothetical protein [bacterium]